MRKMKLLGLFAILLISSLVIFGCNNDSDDGVIAQDGNNAVFSQTVNGQVMRIVISRNAVPDTSRSVITPQTNDHYRIWLAGTSISYGRIERGTGTTIIFIPSSGARFEGNISGSTLNIAAVPLPDGGTVAFTAQQGASPGAGAIGTDSSGTGTAVLQISNIGWPIYDFLHDDRPVIAVIFDEMPSKDLATHSFSGADPQVFVTWLEKDVIAHGMWEKPDTDPNFSSGPINLNFTLHVSENNTWSGGSNVYLFLIYWDKTGAAFLHALTEDGDPYDYDSGSPNLLARNFNSGTNTIDWFDIVDVKFSGTAVTLNNTNAVLSDVVGFFDDGDAEIAQGGMQRVLAVTTTESSGSITSFILTPKARGNTRVVLHDPVTKFSLAWQIVVAANGTITGHTAKFDFELAEAYTDVSVSGADVTIDGGAFKGFDGGGVTNLAIDEDPTDSIEVNDDSGDVVITIVNPGIAVITADDDDGTETTFTVIVDEFGVITIDYESAELEIDPT